MSFDALLDHRVTLVRQIDAGEDDYGQAVTTSSESEPFAAAIQPKGAFQSVATMSGGASVSDHVIYCRTRDVQAADAIVHSSSSCPKKIDLPDATYQLVAPANAAGRGHHLELEARQVG